MKLDGPSPCLQEFANGPNLSQLNPVHALLLHFNGLLPFMPMLLDSVSNELLQVVKCNSVQWQHFLNVSTF